MTLRYTVSTLPPDRATRRQFLSAALGAAGGLASLAGVACRPAGAPKAQAPAQLSGRIRWLVRPSEVENRGQTEVFIPGFTKLHPTVEIEHVITPPGEDYVTKFYTLVAAGEGPDIWGFGGNYAGYWARGLTADLTPLIHRDKFDLTQFHTGLPELFRYKGKYYGLPQLTTFGTLTFYNKELFAQAGLTPPPVDWDDPSWTVEALLETARKLTRNAGTPDAIYGVSFGVWGPHDVAWMWGGDAWLPEHYTEHIAPRSLLDSAASIAGHQFWQDLAWRHHVSPRPGVDPTQGITFQNGRYGMVIAGGWNFWNYTTIKDFKWGVAALPRQAANKNSNYNDFWHLASYSKNVEATWTFMKYITSAEAQRAYSRLTGTPPTVKAAMDVWYQRYEGLMTVAELEKVTQGAIEPRRSVCSPAHHFVEYIPPINVLYNTEIRDRILRNEGSARDVIGKQKPQLDALLSEIYDRWKGKLPG